MKKTKFTFKRWVALRLIVAILLLSIGPTAEAGILNWLAGSPLAASAATDSNLVYLSPTGLVISPVVPTASVVNQLTTIQDSYLMPAASPAKVRVAPIVIKGELIVSATGYSSTPDQTDTSPFTTASGTQVHDGTLAANFLPFRTRVRLPDQFADKVFIVEDRMNARYSNRIDLWFPDRQSADNFGIKTVKLQILEI